MDTFSWLKIHLKVLFNATIITGDMRHVYLNMLTTSTTNNYKL